MAEPPMDAYSPSSRKELTNFHRLGPARLDAAACLKPGQAVQKRAVLPVVLLRLHPAVLADDQLELLSRPAVELILGRVFRPAARNLPPHVLNPPMHILGAHLDLPWGGHPDVVGCEGHRRS